MELYSIPSLPDHIIVRDDVGWWLAAPTPGGWQRRRPYRGHLAGLVPLAGGIATARLVAGAMGIDPAALTDPGVTLAEAALIAGVDASALRHAIADERLAATRIGRDWRVARAELDRYIAERRTWRQ